jgi:hypothetical protein
MLWHGLLTVPRGSTEGLTAAREIVAKRRGPAVEFSTQDNSARRFVDENGEPFDD